MTSPLQQKLRVTGPTVITGNRLQDGAVVHLTGDGGWSTRLKDAAIFTELTAVKEALRTAERASLHVVGLYVAPVNTNSNGKIPGNLREHIRANGPTFDLPSDSAERLRPSGAHSQSLG
jgi:hypothetical protein